MEITSTTEIVVIQSGCGHVIYMPEVHYRARLRDHKTFWCTTCGCERHYPGQSDLERLEARLASKEDQLNTVRADRDRKEAQRRAEKAAKTKIKNRIANGVCIHCNRSFDDLRRHMETKHPHYAES